MWVLAYCNKRFDMETEIYITENVEPIQFFWNKQEAESAEEVLNASSDYSKDIILLTREEYINHVN